MPFRSSILAIVPVVLIAAGCGGSSTTAKERVDACLKKQPEATKADCQAWEKDGQLGDDGAHKGHENMNMDK